MIKRILGLLLLSSCVYGFNPSQYVQISTQTPAPYQSGGINISSMTVTSATITNATVLNQTFTNLTASTITISCSSCGIIGVKDASNAFAGNYGEYLSTATTGYVNAAATANYGDLGNITLTAGDWNLTALEGSSANGSTLTRFIICVSTNQGTNGNNCVDGTNALDGPIALNGVRGAGASIPNLRVNTATSVTYYLKENLSYSGGTAIIAGTLQARRVR